MHPLLQACAIVAGVVAAGMIAGLCLSVRRRLREFRDLHAGSDTVA